MWHFIESIFTITNLQLLLLVGSGVLAVSLLVLALTRWGQSRPLWKCVILSFVAHILLMGYLYGTHLMSETPPVAEKPDPLRVNLIDDFGSSVTEPEPLVELPESQPKPWDRFADHEALPTLDELARPAIDSEVVIERVRPNDIPTPNPGTKIELPNQTDLENLPDSSPTDDASEMEMTADPINAAEIEIARRGENAPAPPQPPKLESPDDVEPAEIDNDFQPNVDSKIPKPANEQFVSEMVDRESELPSPHEIPAPASEPAAAGFKPLKKLRGRNTLHLVSNSIRLGDGQPTPKIYSLRNAETRNKIVLRRGGSIETEAAVNSALRWLADNQEADGRWDADAWGSGRETRVFGHDRKGAGTEADCGITGLATLALLAAGHTHLEGPYQDEIRAALEFLVRQQKINGDLSGDARLFAKMYCHSMSLLALSEALSVTGDQRLLQPVQRGVDFSVNAQNRTDGSWRYQPGDAGDMSQFGWQVMALSSAQLGGARVPRATFDRMKVFLRKCSRGVGGGLASYRPGQGPSTTMTAEALLCRYFLQPSVETTTRMEAARRIISERPSPHHVNLYYWYYGTLALYHAGGPEWENWNSEMKKTLLGLQVKSGQNAGSWPANGVWGGYGGRVYSTAMATLNLEVYYRYLPTYEVADKNRAEFRVR